MALEQAVKDALKKAKDDPKDLKELFETIGVNITLPAPPTDPKNNDEMKKWFEGLQATLKDTKGADTKKGDEDIENNPILKALKAQVDGLVSALGDEKKAREESTKALADKAKSDQDEKIAKYLGDMETDGRLAPKDEEKKKLYQELLESDYAKQVKVFDTMPKNPALAKQETKADPAANTSDPADSRTAYDKTLEAAKAQIKAATAQN